MLNYLNLIALGNLILSLSYADDHLPGRACETTSEVPKRFSASKDQSRGFVIPLEEEPLKMTQTQFEQVFAKTLRNIRDGEKRPANEHISLREIQTKMYITPSGNRISGKNLLSISMQVPWDAQSPRQPLFLTSLRITPKNGASVLELQKQLIHSVGHWVMARSQDPSAKAFLKSSEFTQSGQWVESAQGITNRTLVHVESAIGNGTEESPEHWGVRWSHPGEVKKDLQNRSGRRWLVDIIVSRTKDGQGIALNFQTSYLTDPTLERRIRPIEPNVPNFIKHLLEAKPNTNYDISFPDGHPVSAAQHATHQDVEKITAHILSPFRTYPIVVVSSFEDAMANGFHARKIPGLDSLLRGVAQIYVQADHDFDRSLGAKFPLRTWGGAIRILKPGIPKELLSDKDVASREEVRNPHIPPKQVSDAWPGVLAKLFKVAMTTSETAFSVSKSLGIPTDIFDIVEQRGIADRAAAEKRIRAIETKLTTVIALPQKTEEEVKTEPKPEPIKPVIELKSIELIARAKDESAEIRILEDEIVALKIKLQETVAAVKKADQQVVETQNEFAEFSRDYDRVQDQIAAKDQKIQGLEQESRRLRDEIGFKEALVGESETARAEVEKQLTLLVKENEKLRTGIATKATKITPNGDAKTIAERIHQRLKKGLPGDLSEVVQAVKTIYDGRLVILDTAERTAKESPYRDPNAPWAILNGIGGVMYDQIFNSSLDARDALSLQAIEEAFYAETGYKVAFNDTGATKDNPRARKERTVEYEGKTYVCWSHAKWNGDSYRDPTNLPRIYFHVLREQRKILIGVIGKHLFTAGTQHVH